jgi:hypothetical protein
MMYNMEAGKRPRPPVVLSQAAAATEFELWVRENQYQKIVDSDGLPWNVELSALPVPDPENLPKGMWELRMTARADVTAPMLQATGALDPVADKRLCGMIGTAVIPLMMKPEMAVARTIEEAKSRLYVLIPKVRETLTKESLIPIKRKLVFTWIDRRCLFR